jgi:hypothetical protein
MTQTFSVDSNNDLYLGRDGNISLSYDLPAVLVVCEQAVKVRLGEVVLNTDVGIPFFETAFSGVPNIIQFEAAVRSAILNVDGVTDILSINTTVTETSPAGAVLNYTAVINTTFGQGTVNGGL